MTLQSDPSALSPEQVLVWETRGSVRGFITALRRVPGMEWLAEEELVDLAPDEDFWDAERPERELGGRLYLTVADHQAMEQLQSLWRRYGSEEGERFPHGLAPLRDVFNQLFAIRPWGPEDRLTSGALRDWQQHLAAGDRYIDFEVELWHRRDVERRAAADASVRRVIRESDGEVLASSIIDEIGYHAFAVRAPAPVLERLLQADDTRLVTWDDIMYLQPAGQILAPGTEPGGTLFPAPQEPRPEPTGEPRVALLDGLPMENHVLLAGRLLVDDPEGWASTYLVSQRHHGTAMASLIVNGPLDNPEPALTRPLYVRPILRPEPLDDTQQPRERVPVGVLAPDLVHRAVRRLFGEPDGPGGAPSVRVINLSVGDASRPFAKLLSPWARLLDWLSWQYQVLFIVSGGNHDDDLLLDVPATEFDACSSEEKEASVIRGMWQHRAERRLLSPAESVNALTVGASAGRESGQLLVSYSLTPVTTGCLPQPYSALGLGFGRSVKPEMVAPGGMLILQRFPGSGNGYARLSVVARDGSPGQLVAAPGLSAGDVSYTGCTRGTSNAAALVTRAAAQLMEVLESIGQAGNPSLLEERFTAVLVKALLVHGARWSEAERVVAAALNGALPRREVKACVRALVGYGSFAAERCGECPANRATAVACGNISDDEVHRYVLPLPPGLASVRGNRRLTVTVAWFSPVRPATQRYRAARLKLSVPGAELGVDGTDVGAYEAARGTVIQRVWEGQRAVSYGDGDGLDIEVSCDMDVPEEAVSYALAVSLEAAEELGIPVYDEVRERVQQRIRVAPQILAGG